MPVIKGTATDLNGNPVVRTIRAYRRDNGALLGETVSSNVLPEDLLDENGELNDELDIEDILLIGQYEIQTAFTGEVYVVCVETDDLPLENDLILRTYPI